MTFYRLVKCSNALDYQSIQQFDNYAHITLLGSALSIILLLQGCRGWSTLDKVFSRWLESELELLALAPTRLLNTFRCATFHKFRLFLIFLNLGLNFSGTFSLLLWFVEDLAAKYSQSKLSQLSVILLFSASFSIYRNGESQTKQSRNLKNLGCGRKFENMYHRRTDFHNHDIFGWLGYQTLFWFVFDHFHLSLS